MIIMAKQQDNMLQLDQFMISGITDLEDRILENIKNMKSYLDNDARYSSAICIKVIEELVNALGYKIEKLQQTLDNYKHLSDIK